jgi:hypothetical protein
MPDNTPSPTVTPTSSSLMSDPQVFATAPLHNLLQKTVTDMNETELRQYVATLRTARTSQQTYSKHLKIDVIKSDEPVKGSRSKKQAAVKVDNLSDYLV